MSQLTREIRSMTRSAVLNDAGESSFFEIATDLVKRLTAQQVEAAAVMHVAHVASQVTQYESQKVMQEVAPMVYSGAKQDSDEFATTRTIAKAINKGVVSSDFLAQRRNKLQRSIWVNRETGYMRLGEMRVEHHMLIIEQMTSEIGGLNKKVAAHQTVVGMIEKAGVTCLNEVKFDNEDIDRLFVEATDPKQLQA